MIEKVKRAKPFLVKAHECLMEASDLLSNLPKLRSDEFIASDSGQSSDEHSFVELGSVWQAPLFEIALAPHQDYRQTEVSVAVIRRTYGLVSIANFVAIEYSLKPFAEEPLVQIVGKRKVSTCFLSVQNCEKIKISAFGNLVANETNSDMEADFLNRIYIIPKQSSFYMYTVWYCSLRKKKTIVGTREKRDHGFNLIMIDPPWENSSASQKLKYPTLPNRYFLSLPITRLAHADGALVALWVTNKEKLRIFVEKELFPKWGVKYMATHYWLKVKADGSLIGELDLFHHRPYECLVLGYCHGKNEDAECFSRLESIPDAQVFISIPGDYSRKPPIGEMLRKYIPGSAPAHCLELFARELLAGWTSWGNEPLRFQDTRYFSKIVQQGHT
ncbi:hypothetical protein CTI12_AA547780 [Artemisia annua]|uniref:Methyltransferase-like protein 2 n=1 Tax=Artemisia annua TaxID=35608 RepID=A0A2U1KZT8_ARTAN|nr:hypothetical protein CTI12_AA547780 [Artemisia annua]